MASCRRSRICASTARRKGESLAWPVVASYVPPDQASSDIICASTAQRKGESLAWPVVALCVECAAEGGISCVAGRCRSQLPDLSVLAEKRYQTLHAGY